MVEESFLHTLAVRRKGSHNRVMVVIMVLWFGFVCVQWGLVSRQSPWLAGAFGQFLLALTCIFM